VTEPKVSKTRYEIIWSFHRD